MRALVFVAVVACGPKPAADAPSNTAAAGNEVVLYRDRALVRQRVEFEVKPASKATVRIRVAAGVEAEDIVVFERERFSIDELHVIGEERAPVGRIAVKERDDDEEAPPEEPPAPPASPQQIELVIGAPHAGHYAIHLGYLTDRITWDAAYTMTTTPARDRAVVRGALAIKNATGIALPATAVRVIDAELGATITRASEVLVNQYVGSEPITKTSAVMREIGRVDLVDGETRVELLADSGPRAMRSVLVYDPIGTDLDRPSAAPVRDVKLGVETAAPTRVTESFEVSRDVAATRGLPGGPVRLLERHPDGTLAVLGEARLFEASTRVADVDTIAVGTADAVIGHRERREYTLDEEHKPMRLSEDFVIAIDNNRPTPVTVIVREHMYRGLNWSMAYHSAPAQQEGSQQVSMRMIVPPKSQQKLLYVVVYTWP